MDLKPKTDVARAASCRLASSRTRRCGRVLNSLLQNKQGLTEPGSSKTAFNSAIGVMLVSCGLGLLNPNPGLSATLSLTQRQQRDTQLLADIIRKRAGELPSLSAPTVQDVPHNAGERDLLPDHELESQLDKLNDKLEKSTKERILYLSIGAKEGRALQRLEEIAELERAKFQAVEAELLQRALEQQAIEQQALEQQALERQALEQQAAEQKEEADISSISTEEPAAKEFTPKMPSFDGIFQMLKPNFETKSSANDTDSADTPELVPPGRPKVPSIVVEVESQADVPPAPTSKKVESESITPDVPATQALKSEDVPLGSSSQPAKSETLATSAEIVVAPTGIESPSPLSKPSTAESSSKPSESTAAPSQTTSTLNKVAPPTPSTKPETSPSSATSKVVDAVTASPVESKITVPKVDSKPAKVDSKPAQVDSKPAEVDSKPAKVDSKPAEARDAAGSSPSVTEKESAGKPEARAAQTPAAPMSSATVNDEVVEADAAATEAPAQQVATQRNSTLLLLMDFAGLALGLFLAAAATVALKNNKQVMEELSASYEYETAQLAAELAATQSRIAALQSALEAEGAARAAKDAVVADAINNLEQSDPSGEVDAAAALAAALAATAELSLQLEDEKLELSRQLAVKAAALEQRAAAIKQQVGASYSSALSEEQQLVGSLSSALETERQLSKQFKARGAAREAAAVSEGSAAE